MSDQENVSEILQECEKLLSEHPDDPQTKIDVSNFYFIIGQNLISYWHRFSPSDGGDILRSAREILVRAIEVAPKNSAEKTTLTGQQYALEVAIAGYQEDFLTAASFLEKICILSKRNPSLDPTNFFVHLGNVFPAKEDCPTMESLFSTIIEKEELRRIGTISSEQLAERHNIAIQFWEELLTIMPTDRWAGETSYLLRTHTSLKLKLGWLRAREGKWAEVITLLNSACFYAETVDFEFYQDTVNGCMSLFSSFPDGYKYEPSLVRLHIGISGRSPFWEGH